MLIVILVILGLCLGSFVNALVWRVHEQANEPKRKHPRRTDSKKSRYLKLTGKSRGKNQDSSAAVGMTEGKRGLSTSYGMTGARLGQVPDLSITKGRSMCPQCKHELTAKDLIPVLSWLSLKGKCRYCHKPIGIQYPLVELSTAGLFVASFLFWPTAMIRQNGSCPPVSLLHGACWQDNLAFGLWLVILTGLIALFVYDLRWYLLPNRIMYPLTVLAASFAALEIALADNPLHAAINTALAVLVGGGIFYVLFQASGGKWIGGGDVKLGWLLGLILATPAKSLLMIFIAALLGSLVSIPLLLDKKLKRTSHIPFGPFLIVAAVIVMLFGANILDWYKTIVSL